MKIISSLQNSEIKKVCTLKTGKGRKEEQKFIAEGLRICSTLIESPIKLLTLYVTQDWLDKAQEFAQRSKIQVVSNEVLKKMSTTVSPSGILGAFEIPPIPKAKLSEGIVLAKISDPGNTGTLIRTSAAMGFKTVVVIDGCDPWNPKSIQASAGTIGQCNIFYPYSFNELIQNKKDIKLCALVVKNGKDIKNSSKGLLVVGNEAEGIPEYWIKQCEEKVTLKMPGKTESLNAAVAGSIALYLWKNK